MPRTDVKECPKCHYEGVMDYESADPGVGIFGYGWVCPKCEEFIQDDTDSFDD